MSYFSTQWRRDSNAGGLGELVGLLEHGLNTAQDVSGVRLPTMLAAPAPALFGAEEASLDEAAELPQGEGLKVGKIVQRVSGRPLVDGGHLASAGKAGGGGHRLLHHDHRVAGPGPEHQRPAKIRDRVPEGGELPVEH